MRTHTYSTYIQHTLACTQPFRNRGAHTTTTDRTRDTERAKPHHTTQTIETVQTFESAVTYHILAARLPTVLVTRAHGIARTILRLHPRRTPVRLACALTTLLLTVPAIATCRVHRLRAPLPPGIFGTLRPVIGTLLQSAPRKHDTPHGIPPTQAHIPLKHPRTFKVHISIACFQTNTAS